MTAATIKTSPIRLTALITAGMALVSLAGAGNIVRAQAQAPADKPAAPRAVPVTQDKPAVARPVVIPPPQTGPIVAKPIDPKNIKDPAARKAAEKAREDLITYADLLFSHKEWKLAAQSYQEFLQQHPSSPNAPSAWYRLGECYLAAEQKDDAIASFSHLVKRYKTGEYVGAGAYRLGTASYTAGDHQAALGYFTTAAAEAPAAELQLQARYYRARCLELLKKNQEAIAAYREVLAVEPAKPKDAKGDAPGAANPFAERASLSIARLLNESDDTEAAFKEYLALSETAKTPAIRQESQARAGLLAAQLGKTEESNRLLDAVLSSGKGKAGADAEWRGTAQVALIFNLYAAEEYEKVVGVYSRGIASTPDEVRPKMLMMVANSMRQIGDLKAAAKVYRIIEKGYRKSDIAAEAVFRKLQCLDQLGDLDLVNEINRFVKSQTAIDSKSPFIDLSLLMQGEWYFKRSEWKPAAKSYAAVRSQAIDEKYRSALLYKLGWAQTESDDAAKGIANLSSFISDYPDDPYIPSALAKRATSQQALGNRADALEDYRLIAAEHSDSAQFEFALEQIAFIHNVQREVPEMVAAYRNLLEKFPQTAGAAEAWYYIGAGHYDQQKYSDALEPLRTARKIDAKAFTTRASEVLILCLFRLKDVAGLAAEADLALSAKPPLSVPIPVLNYLGEALFQKADFRASERFFSASSTPSRPGETPSAVWDYLGRARHEIGVYGGAVIAFDNYLGIVQRPGDRAEGYINKGYSLLAKKAFEAADESAREALKLVHQGKLNARARLLRGDIAFARGDHDSASREYFITSQIFVGDPEITPQAIAKASLAYRAAGDTAKADELDARLQQDFPGYKLPE